MSSAGGQFYVTGGTLSIHAPCYVERHADTDMAAALLRGDFCYVLTAHQMGKSSLMVRTAHKLRQQGVRVAVLDLTSVGHKVTPEQWFDGLAERLGLQLGLEDELDAFWRKANRLGPCQRFFTALHDVVLPAQPGPVVVFVDEIGFVRSLPFRANECFAGLRECYNRRAEDAELNRLSFCLLGAAAPSQMAPERAIPLFNIGCRIELTDFTPEEAAALLPGLGQSGARGRASQRLLDRILHWTHGHPYLTQKLFCAVADTPKGRRRESEQRLVDRYVAELFLSPAARDNETNLAAIRDRICQTTLDLAALLDLYHRIWRGEKVADDDTNELVNELRLSGLIDARQGRLAVRNRIYQQIFDAQWIAQGKPLAELEISDGRHIRICGICSLGRTPDNQVVLPDRRVSRRHAVIERRRRSELCLIDLGSRNGTLLNGRAVSRVERLRHQDRIEIGPYTLEFQELNPAPTTPRASATTRVPDTGP